LRDNKGQYTFALEPAVGVLQEDQFQSFVLSLPVFPIVRWVQVEQGHRLRTATDVECIGVQHLNSQSPGLRRSMCVDLDSIPQPMVGSEKCCECGPISNAGIERCELLRESEPSPQTNGFGLRQREKTEFGLPLKAHTAPPSSTFLEFDCNRFAGQRPKK
jgi:hypothetical protein